MNLYQMKTKHKVKGCLWCPWRVNFLCVDKMKHLESPIEDKPQFKNCYWKRNKKSCYYIFAEKINGLGRISDDERFYILK